MQDRQEARVGSLGQEDPLEKGMVTHSSILAWRIPWTEETGGLQSMGLLRVQQDWSNWTHTHTHTQWRYQWCGEGGLRSQSEERHFLASDPNHRGFFSPLHQPHAFPSTLRPHWPRSWVTLKPSWATAAAKARTWDHGSLGEPESRGWRRSWGKEEGSWGGGGFLGRRVLATEGDIRRGKLGRGESRKVGEGHPRRSAGRGP